MYEMCNLTEKCASDQYTCTYNYYSSKQNHASVVGRRRKLQYFPMPTYIVNAVRCRTGEIGHNFRFQASPIKNSVQFPPTCTPQAVRYRM